MIMSDSPKHKHDQEPFSLSDLPGYTGSVKTYAQSATTQHADASSAAR